MKTYDKPPQKDWGALTKRPELSRKPLEKLLSTIDATIQRSGDDGLMQLTKQYDDVQLQKVSLNIETVRKLADTVEPKLQAAITQAAQNLRLFQSAQQTQPTPVIQTVPGVMCWSEVRAIDSVGLYVPGGTAPLVSTVLMLGIPAQIAGCKTIVLCTPPNDDGVIDPALCFAGLLVGVTNFVCVGGAQSIIALARGTESVPKVDKVFGPGNQYVTAAKNYIQQLSVPIDMPAGPSEVMVVTDLTAIPAYVAADLLSQAEHGPDSQVILVTTSRTLANKIESEIAAQLLELPRRNIAEKALENSLTVVLEDTEQMLAFANQYAPEHLILACRNARQLAKKVLNAGSVFIGNYSPESAGDYASGTNHTLPTNGAARNYSGLTTASFQKTISFQQLTKAGLRRLAPTIEALAETEGLQAHKRAVTIRK